MKILLINPPWQFLYGKFKPAAKVGVNMPPLGLIYISGYARENGYKEIKIIDTEVSGYSIEMVKEYNPDVIGISSVSPNFQAACNIADEIKKHLSVPVILGGVHVTVAPKESMEKCLSFDYAVIGEGEITFKELLDAIKNNTPVNDIKGIVYRENNSIFQTAPRELVKDLDILPFPARKLIEYTKYNFSVPKSGIAPLTLMVTSRGCPYDCIFCASKTIWGRNTRFRSADNVIAEIKEIAALGIKYIAFSDDTFTLKRDRVIDICNKLIKENLGITWQMMTRANLFDEELLILMKKAGLVRMSIGIESGDPEILRKIKKGVTLEEIEKAYKIAKKVGIETRGSIMIGHPFETKESMMKTLKFARNLSECMQMYINISTPFPGTELYEMAKTGTGGLNLITQDLAEFRRYGNAVVTVNDLSRNDLIRYQKIGFWMFYMTPKRIWYNIFRAGPEAAIKNIKAFLNSLLGK